MMLAWYLADVGLVEQAQDILAMYPEPVVLADFWTVTPWGIMYVGP